MKIAFQIEYRPGSFSVTYLLRLLKAFGVTYHIIAIERQRRQIPLSERICMSVDFIKMMVSNATNMPVELMVKQTRKREIVENRQIAMYFSKQLTRESLASIGSQIGDKDHATVLHACKTVENLKSTNPPFRTKFEKIEKILTL